MTKYYINLTNGIEYLKDRIIVDYSFIRIQSTACEQKRWGFILLDLDYDFLMNLALGNKCVVVDYSAKNGVPRAIWQGLEWIKFILNKVWFDKEYTPNVRGHNCYNYFLKQYKQLLKNKHKSLIKLKYFKKFLDTDSLKLETKTDNTDLDGDYGHYTNILWEKNNELSD